jgi:outer membrane receptor protein involved in Fe transport
VVEDTFQIRTKDDFHYAQLDHRTGRLKLIAGALHARRIDRSLVRIVEAGQESVLRLPSPGDSRWQPYGVATIQVAPRTLVRLIGHERFRRINRAALLPTEPFLTGEQIFVGFGGGLLQTFELDLEHRFSPLLFSKLFLFRSDIRTFQVVEPVTVSPTSVGFFVPRARIEGFGVRLERQLTPLLAGYLRWTSSRTTDRTQGSTHGWQLPQRPRASLLLGLNFVDRAGTKALLEGVYSSGVYAESFWSNSEGFDPLAPRPREPGRWLLNLRFGREHSVRQEWIFRIDNLLNHAYSLWPGIPGRGRTASLELRWRF